MRPFSNRLHASPKYSREVRYFIAQPRIFNIPHVKPAHETIRAITSLVVSKVGVSSSGRSSNFLHDVCRSWKTTFGKEQEMPTTGRKTNPCTLSLSTPLARENASPSQENIDEIFLVVLLMGSNDENLSKIDRAFPIEHRDFHETI